MTRPRLEGSVLAPMANLCLSSCAPMCSAGAQLRWTFNAKFQEHWRVQRLVGFANRTVLCIVIPSVLS
jgi:hypothetical protein